MGGGHAHAHEHRPDGGGFSPLAVAIALTGTVFLAELVGGWWTGSLALLADAAHMAIDLLGLSLSLVAATLARLPADPRRTFGYRRVEVLAALGNAVALMIATGFILREAWSRWVFPTPIAAGPMVAVAVLGLIANLGSAAVLWRASSGNINLRGALMHVLSDAAGSVGAIIAGIVILFTKWYAIDALVSAFICAGIVLTAFWLLRDSVHILLEGAPAHLDLYEVRAALEGVKGVRGVHDLHLWCVTQGSDAMSAHIEAEPGADHAAVLKAGRRLMEERFHLTHITLQIELEEDR